MIKNLPCRYAFPLVELHLEEFNKQLAERAFELANKFLKKMIENIMIQQRK